MGESDRWDRWLVKWESRKEFLACEATPEGLKEGPHREQEQPTQYTSDRQQRERAVEWLYRRTLGDRRRASCRCWATAQRSTGSPQKAQQTQDRT